MFVLVGDFTPRIGKIKREDMRSKFYRLARGCFPLLLFVALSCTWNQELTKPTGEKEFLRESSRLEKLAREDPDPSVRAKSHLKLAFLYVNSRNPQLNYTRALQEMESYLSMSPAEAQKDDFQNWLAVLKALDRERTEIKKLRASLKKVRDTNEDLDIKVTELQEMIEKLKDLDFQTEEKRNLMK